jgi:hypothetical protein
LWNRASTTRELNIPVDNTPLERAHQLQPVFGNAPAEAVNGNVLLLLPAQSLAAFCVR